MKQKLKKLLLTKNGQRFSVVSILVLFALVLFAMQYTSVRQKKIDIKEGQLAEETIRAPKTVENVTETEAKQKLAEEAVTPEYTYQNNLEEDQVNRVEQLFDAIAKVNDELDTKYQSDLKKATNKDSVSKPTVKEKVAALKSKFETFDEDDVDFYQKLPDSFYEEVFTISSDEVKSVRDLSTKLIQEAMSQRIREENLSTVRSKAVESLNDNDLSKDGLAATTTLLENGIVANEIYNEKKNDALKKAASNAVTPVMIYQGEIIIREGVQVDAKAIQKLQLLGLLGANTTIMPLVALALVVILQICVLALALKQPKTFPKKMRFLLFYVGMMTLSILLMKFVQIFQTESVSYVPLIFPAAFTPLVLNLFISRSTGLMAAIFQMAFSIFVFYDSVGTSTLLAIVICYAFSGMLANMVQRKRIGSQLGVASLWLIVFPLFFTIVLEVYQGLTASNPTTWTTLICSAAGYVLTFLMSIGLHPYIELLLNDDSMIVLNELSNPNHPLLKQLLEEAPGTYHHSMMVANLSANAVAEIGGRSLITRVACYYHDIGKIKHANFFVENLPAGAENPHNFLLPEDSKQIIFGHVTDGAKILEDAKMPKLVIDICWQHHGTTLMKYFYVKAKERDDSVTEADFRYPGPKPQTREAAVVSIADTCEAAVRAMDHPTNDKIREFVHNVIQGRLADGQLDECDITMRELHIVEESLINGLCSTFHSRIKYPKMKSEAEEMKEEQEGRA